jgi:hypothetical protein
MHTVAEVLRPDFPRSWQEAVAIVQAAASQMVPGVGLPEPDDLQFEEDGSLTFGFGSESGQDPVQALAGLLDDLLQGVEAPGSLRDLARENGRSSPSHATIASFSQALAFFERPNRANDLRAVVGRLNGARFRPADEEFERLRQKVAGEATAPEATPEQEKPPQKEPEPKQQKKKPELSKRQRAVALVAVLVVVFGTVALRFGAVSRTESLFEQLVAGGFAFVFGKETAAAPAQAAPDASPAAAAEEPVEKAARESRAPATNERVRPAGNAASAGSGGDASRRSQPARSTSRERAPVAGAVAQSKPNPTPSFAPIEPKVPPLPPAAPPAATRAEPAASQIATLARPEIFSRGNPEVQAPVLIRPQMPREPAPGSDTGYFDLVVDENGDVSQIKLLSPRRKYYDRMLVAAAKAWKFRPAMLNGRPVKYRLQVPIIMAGMPGK